jgi:hypothetical protein
MSGSGDIKERLLTKNDKGSSLVVEEGLFHDPFKITAQRKNPDSLGIVIHHLPVSLMPEAFNSNIHGNVRGHHVFQFLQPRKG